MTLLAQTQQFHEEILVEVDVEHRRVFVGLIGEEDSDRCEYGCRYEFAEQDRPLTIAGHSHAGVIEDVIHDEHEHGDDDGHSKSTLTDDGTQRGTDEEEYQTGKGQRELADSLDLMLAIVSVEPTCIVDTYLHIRHRGLDRIEGILY